MKALRDSVVIKQVQMESNSAYVQLFCTAWIDQSVYETHYFYTMEQFNILLNELSARELELDFDNFITVVLAEDEEIYSLDLGEDAIILPFYCMPEQSLAMIA